MTGVFADFSGEYARGNSSHKGFLLDRVWVRSADGTVTRQ